MEFTKSPPSSAQCFEQGDRRKEAVMQSGNDPDRLPDPALAVNLDLRSVWREQRMDQGIKEVGI